MEIREEMIRDMMRVKLPGVEAHDRLMPFKRPTPAQAFESGKSPKVGAVLMLVYPHQGQLFTVLTRRPEYPGVHSAQISFPGGKQEDQDHSLEHTALRETWEEVGVDMQSVEVLGPLTSLYIPPSNFVVHPFLGWTASKPDWVPDAREVDAILEPTLSHLMAEHTLVSRSVPSGIANSRIQVRGFQVEQDFVWGATAMVLMEFREAMRAMQG